MVNIRASRIDPGKRIAQIEFDEHHLDALRDIVSQCRDQALAVIGFLEQSATEDELMKLCKHIELGKANYCTEVLNRLDPILAAISSGEP